MQRRSWLQGPVVNRCSMCFEFGEIYYHKWIAWGRVGLCTIVLSEDQDLKIIHNQEVCHSHLGSQSILQEIQFCELCTEEKNHRSPFPMSGGKRSKERLGLLQYFLTFIDDYSLHLGVYVIQLRLLLTWWSMDRSETKCRMVLRIH